MKHSNLQYKIYKSQLKRMNSIYRMSSKKVINALPQISKYGSVDILLESSIRPLIKTSTSSAIKILKQVAFKNQIVSLSANQIGLQQRVFVVLKDKYIKPGKWKQYEQQFQKHQITNAELGYDAIISPIQVNSSFDQYFAFQQCPSFVGLRFKVKIPIFSNIKYLTQKVLQDFLRTKSNKQNNHFPIPQSLYSNIKLSGFKGRVWDHQIRHLEGVLPIHEKICNGQFQLLDQYKNDMDNILYFEQLRQIEENYLQKNLKIAKKNQQAKLKARKQNNNKIEKIDLSKLTNFSQIPQMLKNANSFKTKQIIKPQNSKLTSPLSTNQYKNMAKQKNIRFTKNNK